MCNHCDNWNMRAGDMNDPRWARFFGADHVFVNAPGGPCPHFAPVDVVADWNGCRNAASVWDGAVWVSCVGPNSNNIDRRCPDCDFRAHQGD